MRVSSAWWLCLVAATGLSGAAAADINDSGVKVPWSYVGSTGPSHWGMLSPAFEACDLGKSQSPINIGRKKTRVPYDLKINYQPAKLYLGDDLQTELMLQSTKTVVDTGHGVQVNFHDKHAHETITYAGSEYELIQFHLHSPSETQWHQQSFPLEIHFVHQGKDGKVAVLAVLVKGGEENPVISKIIKNLPKEQRKEVEVRGEKIDPSQLLPQDRRYYAFSGSLTTPPCIEGLQWIVMPTPITASPAQILEIREAAGGNNARPVQPMNDRVLSYAVQ
jgi:carbonic anhydrase